MANKKKTQAKPQILSPEGYIREKVRSLPIVACYRSGDWEKVGCANVIVARQHPQGNYTYGHYIVDTYCRGVVMSYYQFSQPEWDFKEMMEQISQSENVVKVDYTDAHNLIFGAIAYAEKAGVRPHASFELTRYILEERTAGIPFVEFKFGKNGIHHVVADTEMEANFFRTLLRKNLGDKFGISIYKGEYGGKILEIDDELGACFIDK